jgi:threonine dehydrogenase-like Zn-dependent dehydrogenase
MKIAIAGTGYVGLSNAILLAQHNEVVAVDIVPEKIAQLNRKQSPIEDKEIEDYLQHKQLNFTATLDKHSFIRHPRGVNFAFGLPNSKLPTFSEGGDPVLLTTGFPPMRERQNRINLRLHSICNANQQLSPLIKGITHEQ